MKSPFAKNNRRLMLCSCIAFLVILASACREVFTPEIESSGDIVVVDGIITNGKGVNYIKLSKAGSIREKAAFKPVTAARVAIIENGEDTMALEETTDGFYELPPGFSGMPGNTYQLKFTIDKNNAGLEGHYGSTVQRMPFSQSIDSIHGRRKEGQFIDLDLQGDNSKNRFSGSEVFLDIMPGNNHTNYYRFAVEFYVQYRDKGLPRLPTGDSTLYFCWQKNTPPGISNTILSASKYDLSSGNIEHLNITFLPFDKRFYKVPAIEDYGLILKQYGLNAPANNYYQKFNEQLQAENKIFEPMAIAPDGNITCTSDQEQVVLGFFEASSLNLYNFHLTSFPSDSLQGFEQVTKRIDTLSDRGCRKEPPPDFWL